jgi:4-diphosphocytidyl-2-C-methyl-D-erythritol kinase
MRDADGTLRVPANAKINLILLVDPPLPATHPKAGYHEIASWFSCIALHDDVTLTRLASGQPSTTTMRWADDAIAPTPIDWPVEKDLAVRAHRSLERVLARELPIHLDVTKRIPVGGGLGGGSSDAAATLVGLNQLFALGLTAAALRDIGAVLGSDIAFFIDDEQPARPALVAGLGDVVERLPRLSVPLTLAVPDFGCPTGAVYRAFDARPTLRGHASVAKVREAAAAANRDGQITGSVMTGLTNDLAAAAMSVEPRLASVLAALDAAFGGGWHVTGSGSCCFRLGHADHTHAEIASPHAVRLIRSRLV